MQYTKAIIILSHVPIVVAVVSAVLQYKRLGSALQVFCWFIFFSAPIQLVSLLLWYNKINNMPLAHLYVAGGFVFLAWFYRRVLDHFIKPLVLWVVAALFVLFCAANTLFFQPLFVFNSYSLMAESVLVIILSLFTFLFLLNYTIREAGIPDVKSLAWINSGLFIYFLSCFLIYCCINIMVTSFSPALRRTAWMFHSFFSVVMYCCFIIGLWKRSKTRV